MAGLLGVGQSALMAAYAQLQTTGHNIANAHTPGYSRQEAILATAGGRYTGSGYIGGGVDVVTVQRSYDRFLAAQVSTETASSAAAGARAEQLGRLDRLMADTDNGIGAAMDELNAALADVVNRPFDPSAREAFMQRAGALAQRFQATDQRMQQLRSETDERIAQSSAGVNDVLERIARLNERIAQSSGGGQPPNDLLDERDRTLVELNGYMKATAYAQADGTVSVFAAGGEGLVVGNRAATLSTEPDPADATRERLVLSLGAARLAMNADSAGGGSLAGLMRFRDVDLPAVRARLGTLAEGVAKAWNDQQAAGVDAAGAKGQAMFASGGPPFAANGFAFVLPSGSALATGYAMSAEIGAANGGDMSIASFSPVPGASGSAQAVTLVFDASAGAFEVLDKSTGAPTGTKLAYTPGEPLVHDGYGITLRGTPKAGDRVDVAPTRDPAADNRNARAMMALADQKLVSGAGSGSGSASGGDATFGDAFAAMLVDVGTRTRSAKADESVSQRLLQDAKGAQAAQSGVNLDEEAARLMQHQQMYQAAAKVIQAAQTMFDTLLSTASR